MRFIKLSIVPSHGTVDEDADARDVIDPDGDVLPIANAWVDVDETTGLEEVEVTS